MPDCQNRLIEAVAEVNPNVIVVLHNGAPVEMPWIDRVRAVLEVYLGGQAVGAATVRVLYGEVNPSGHLAETFPLRLQDTPCYLTYGGENDRSEYREGIFVGYRYYTSREMPVLFPFGHGLSYTTFVYSHLRLDKSAIRERETLEVSVDITNTGRHTGKEVVQLYVAPKTAGVIRPIRELKAFDKIERTPGETRTVRFMLDRRAFAYWETEIHDWFVQTGTYEIQIGKNATEMLLTVEVSVESERVIPRLFHMNSTLGEIMADPRGGAIFEQLMGGAAQTDTRETSKAAGEAINDEMIAAMMEGMPLRQMRSFMPGITREMLEGILAALNQGKK